MAESITLQPRVSSPSQSRTRGQRWREIRNSFWALVFLSPSLIVFVIFVFIPLVRSVELSFHFTNPLGQMRGDLTLEHYQTLFAKPDFLNSVRVSVLFALNTVVFTMVGAMFLALLGNIRLRGISVFRTMFSSTIAVSGATASLIFLFLYNPSIGVFNYFLDLAHLPRVMWLKQHRAVHRLTLMEQLDYQGKLEQQFPIQPERIVYSKSGMHLVASRLNDRRVVVDHKLYWATAASAAEALYLCAILNSATFTELARPLMSYGKDERDFDKHIWQLPVPLYDPKNDLHSRLSARGAELEAAIGELKLDRSRHFAAVRRDVREFIAGSEAGRDVEELVEELLS